MAPALSAQHVPMTGFQGTHFYSGQLKGQKQLVPKTAMGHKAGGLVRLLQGTWPPQQASCWHFLKGVCCVGVWGPK